MLPHQDFWRDGYGLVVDGARFTKARADTAMGQPKSLEYDAIGDAAAAEPKDSIIDSPATKQQVDPDSPMKAVNDGRPLFGDDGDGAGDDDDGDDLVE